MLRRFSNIFTLSFLLVAFMAMTAFAAKSPVDKKRSTNKRVSKALYYSIPDETFRQEASGTASLGKSKLTKSSSATSPGTPIGTTWYDYQHNGSMGRMIDIGNNATSGGTGLVHFSWMNLPGAELVGRHYSYSSYNSNTVSISTESIPNAVSDYGGYVNIQSANDGRAVIGGHNDEGAGNQVHLYYDVSPGGGFWTDDSRVPDAVAGFHNPGEVAIWPKFAYQEGTLDVTHVFTSASVGDGLQYFRKVGTYGAGTWDPVPYMVDTAFDIAQVIVASKTSDKVAMGWMANINYDVFPDQFAPGVCDTCSGVSGFATQWDNDVYYQTSDDQGATWNPRVNVTKYRLGEASYRAYTDMTILLDDNDFVHVAWGAVPWAAELANVNITDANRIFHFTDAPGISVIRTVANGEWEGDCTAGAWNLTMSKMQISQCQGKLFVLWIQINDVPNGVSDDCAARGGPSSANGEIYSSISSDNGLTWDAPRNLTNSRTPGCDPSNGGADCESDNWMSSTRLGRQNVAGEDWSPAVIVDPSGGAYAGDFFIDVQYIHDRDAGGVIQNEGSWQIQNLNWFRMPCVEPISAPSLNLSPTVIDAPIWTKPSVQLDQALTLENSGNFLLTYGSPVVEQDGGPSNWLAVSGLSGSVPSGLSNVEVGTIHLNNLGVQTTEAGLVGRIIFTSDAPTSPDTIHVNLLVVDTLTPTVPDTVIGYLSLLVQSNGNYGNSGAGENNLDYVTTNGDDCDTTGNADVYLYDGSPVIAMDNGTDTTAFWSIFGDGWLNASGFKPQGGQSEGSEPSYNWYSSGTFTTPDSTVALEQTFYAPTANGANYMVKALKVWSHDGATHAGLRIGDAIDWDIPSDSGAENSSAIDAPRNLIYQIGAEWDTDDTTDLGAVDGARQDCIDDDRRFGGMAFLKSMLNGADHNTVPFSAYTARNDSFVFPAGNFIPAQLYENMGNSGLTTETTAEDQHMVMTYEPGFALTASDTIVFYTVFATVLDGIASDMGTAVDAAEAFAIANNYWVPIPDTCDLQMPGDFDGSGSIDGGDLVGLTAYITSGGAGTPPNPQANGDVDGDCDVDQADLDYMTAFIMAGGPAPVACTCQNPPFSSGSCCIGTRGDVNSSGSTDVSDLVYLVAFSFQGGPPPPCPDQADVNGSGSTDVSDLVYLVAFSFQGGPSPVACP